LGIIHAVGIGSSECKGQEFPTKPPTLVIAYPPGGSFDLIARAYASAAMEYLKQPLVFMFKAGASGAIGSDFVANTPPDGYTLLVVGPGANSALPAIEGRSKGPMTSRQCVPLAGPRIITASSDAPFKTFKEMIAWAKANPGKLTFGHTGIWQAADIPWKNA